MVLSLVGVHEHAKVRLEVLELGNICSQGSGRTNSVTTISRRGTKDHGEGCPEDIIRSKLRSAPTNYA